MAQIYESVSEQKYAVAYVRVSTEEQTVENQKMAIQEYANRLGYAVLDYWEDAAISGKVPAMEREGFSRMMKFLQTEKVDACFVYELSRIGRSFYETLAAIQYIEKYCMLITTSPKESFLQTTDPSIRKLLTSIISWVAERERENIIERTKAGMARAKSQGKIFGRPKRDFPESIVKQIYDCIIAGNSTTRIAKDLSVSKVTLYRELHLNPIFKFYWSEAWQKVKARVQHEV